MSAEYMHVMQGRQEAVMERYFQAARACESTAARDHAAAVLLQRRWRGYRDRAWLGLLSSRAGAIQRVWRGYQGRLRFAEALTAREREAQASFYDAMATRIQAWVRGRQARVHTQDLYARRAYIARVGEAGTALLAASDAALSEQLVNLSSGAGDARMRQFERVVGDAHHLLSTAAIPGVFRSPLGPHADATAFDVPVEEHIKEAFQNRQTQLRQMRKNVFTPSPPRAFAASTQPQLQQSPQHQFQQHAAFPAAVAASPSGRGSSAGSSRASRPTSAGRLAPLHAQPAPPLPVAPAVAAPSSSFDKTQLRGAHSHSSLSATSSSSSLHNSHLQQNGRASAAGAVAGGGGGGGGKLPSLSPFSSSSPTSSSRASPALHAAMASTASGRHINAQQLYDSKLRSAEEAEEKQQQQYHHLPLGLGGGPHTHVSTPTTPVPLPVGGAVAASRAARLHAAAAANQTHSLAATRNLHAASKPSSRQPQQQPALVPLRAGL